ncbi:AtpZ/AtpI family protein [Haliscomenobacter sp.]|uniref:AtpZ/AtpI family protein n=1 Tax=Haliscomenobacter sp. TaxID=2717303 RepID=UPI003365093E
MKKEPKPPITDQKEAPTGKATPNMYLKYSGMAFQMGAIILIGAIAGQKLDQYFHTTQPWFTLVFSLLSIFAALYVSLKDFLTSNNNQRRK